MKKILILIALIVICKGLFAQRDTIPHRPYTKFDQKWYRFLNYISWDSIGIMSLTDTTQVPYRAGGFTAWMKEGEDTANPYFYDGQKWKLFNSGGGGGDPEDIQETLNIGRNLTQVDSIESNSYFNLTSTTSPIAISAKDQGLMIQNYTGQPRITFKNDSGETPTTENGGMISGSSNGGAIVFGNNFDLDTISNRYLKLGFIDNDLNFTTYTLMSENLGVAYTYNYAVNSFYDSVFAHYLPDGTPGVDSVLVKDINGLIRKVAASSFGTTITADNGLTMSTATNVQLGGSLLQETIINGQHNWLELTNIDYFVAGGLVDTTEARVFASASGLNSGASIVTTNTSTVFQVFAGDAEIEASNNLTGIDMILHISDSSMLLQNVSTKLFNINYLGRARLPQYGLGVFGGTPAFTLSVDASGNIIETSTAGGGVTTFSAGTTGFTPNSATSGAITLAGTLDVDNGGTGQTSYTNGQLLIGNTSGNTLTKATLTAGTGISITNGTGSITIAAIGLTRQIITSGSSSTVTGGNYIVTIDPASTLAAYTLTLPASPSDLDIVEVDFGGTLTSGTIVTSLTISPNSGQTILDNTPPVSATADNTLFYRYRTANTKWYRFKP